MTSNWKFSVKGAKEAKKIMDDLAEEVKNGPITPDTLYKVADATKNLAVVRTPVRTGNLKNHNQIDQISRTAVRIFNDAEYSGYVNFGTSKMVARPFFTAAINQAKKQFPQVFTSEMKKKVDDVIRDNQPSSSTD